MLVSVTFYGEWNIGKSSMASFMLYFFFFLRDSVLYGQSLVYTRFGCFFRADEWRQLATNSHKQEIENQVLHKPQAWGSRSAAQSARCTQEPFGKSGNRHRERLNRSPFLGPENPLRKPLHPQERNAFRKVHQETFGKSGCRRIVPGEYVATDPKGRACMIAAVEKQKLVRQISGRDCNNEIMIIVQVSINICLSVYLYMYMYIYVYRLTGL